MRRLIAFPCAGETLLGTLDEGAARIGLLIVSGGNEIRCGAHRGMALLAERIARRGFPVFRFDRRGIGDSTGRNAGFRGSAPDIAAAAASFASEAQLTRIVAFGNCDAATGLALFHSGLPVDALVLANPWVIDDADGLPPAAAIRAHYLRQLRNPLHLWRSARTGVSFRKLLYGLHKIVTASSHNPLATSVHDSLTSATIPIEIVLAEQDATAIAFADDWRGDLATHCISSASHSFAGPGDAAAIEEILIAALSR